MSSKGLVARDLFTANRFHRWNDHTWEIFHLLTRSSKNILRRVSESAMEKFVINGDHINTCTSDVMNWRCPDPYSLQHFVHKGSCSLIRYPAIYM